MVQIGMRVHERGAGEHVGGMSFKRQKVLAALRLRGMAVLREGGAHTIVGKPDGVRTSLPRHSDLDRLTVRAIAKQLRIDWKELEKDIR